MGHVGAGNSIKAETEKATRTEQERRGFDKTSRPDK
jgi:hypothetical protein